MDSSADSWKTESFVDEEEVKMAVEWSMHFCLMVVYQSFTWMSLGDTSAVTWNVIPPKGMMSLLRGFWLLENNFSDDWLHILLSLDDYNFWTTRAP